MLQAVYFDTRMGWDTTNARSWLARHQHHPIKRVDKSGHLLRYRLAAPNFVYYSTKKTPGGIYFVFGYESLLV